MSLEKLLFRDPYRDNLRQWNSELYRLFTSLRDDLKSDLEPYKKHLFEFKGDPKDNEYRIYYNLHLRNLQDLQLELGLPMDDHPLFEEILPTFYPTIYPDPEEVADRVYVPLHIRDHDHLVFVDDPSWDDLPDVGDSTVCCWSFKKLILRKIKKPN